MRQKRHAHLKLLQKETKDSCEMGESPCGVKVSSNLMEETKVEVSLDGCGNGGIRRWEPRTREMGSSRNEGSMLEEVRCTEACVGGT